MDIDKDKRKGDSISCKQDTPYFLPNLLIDNNINGVTYRSEKS